MVAVVVRLSSLQRQHLLAASCLRVHTNRNTKTQAARKMKIDTITSAQAALTSARVATLRCQRLVIASMLQQVDELEGHTNATVPGEANSLGGASRIPYFGSQTSSQLERNPGIREILHKIAKNTTRRYTNVGMRKQTYKPVLFCESISHDSQQ